MGSAMFSRVIGLVRVKYIAWLLGRSAAADAFNAAFQLPDMLLYFLVGGAASITVVTMLSRYRESGREADGDRDISVILTTVVLVLSVAILIAEFATPWYVRLWFNGFSPEKVALCTLLTRIVLPTPICFFVGGVFGARLLTHRIFSVQAVAPLIYNGSMIVGGVILGRMVGVSSLAIGAMAGGICGPLLLNAAGALRIGMRFRPALDWTNPGLREYVRMSLPLMLGVSLVQADTWIINHYASQIGGAISLLAYAKQMFNAPISLGQAAGSASLPFLASLYHREDRKLFERSVNSSVSQLVSFSLLLSAFLTAMAFPIADVLLRGGALKRDDAHTTALYLAIFSFSLFLWSTQPIFARAFFAAGDMMTPMVASTIFTFATLPVYPALYRLMGPAGLAVASDIGILFQTLVLALLLHRRGMVSLSGLEYGEMGRALLVSLISGSLLAGTAHVFQSANRLWECSLLAGAVLAWFVVSLVLLRALGSAIPDRLMAKLRR